MSIETDTWGLSPLMTALIVIFCVLLAIAVGRGLFVWIRNNRSPVQTVNARVTSKRMKVSGHGISAARNASAANRVGSSVYTNYFITFEMELGVKESEFGMLAEGDSGRLTFQGTRYHGFERV